MSAWKFQIIANEEDIAGQRSHMDPTGKELEDEVNDALRYPFKFHKVNKIVLCLGKKEGEEGDYAERLGVGLKQWPNFDLHAYVRMTDEDKIEALRAIVIETFDWLEANFDDAHFVSIARKNLTWA